MPLECEYVLTDLADCIFAEVTARQDLAFRCRALDLVLVADKYAEAAVAAIEPGGLTPDAVPV